MLSNYIKSVCLTNLTSLLHLFLFYHVCLMLTAASGYFFKGNMSNGHLDSILIFHFYHLALPRMQLTMKQTSIFSFKLSA